MSPRPPLLRVVVHDLSISPGLTGLCAGFERGAWRCEALADGLIEALPEFALTYSEYTALNHTNAVPVLRQVARRIYETEKFQSRGEFGELLLHVVLKQVFETVPAVSKIFYKDANNVTVKGFDAVHVVASTSGLELWLGEAKFYSDARDAVRKIAEDIRNHSGPDYLRGEFIAIKNKIDDRWPHADRLRRLLDDRTSLDDVFATACVPALITFDANATARHTSDCAEYERELTAEFKEVYGAFSSEQLPADIRIHLLLVPLKTKQDLTTALDARLRSWQTI